MSVYLRTFQNFDNRVGSTFRRSRLHINQSLVSVLVAEVRKTLASFYPLGILLAYIVTFIFVRIQKVDVNNKLRKIFSHNGGQAKLLFLHLLIVT